MRVLVAALMALVFGAAGPGCSIASWGGKVDEEQHASHLLFYAGADGYADLNKVVMAAAVSMGDKKHSIQRQYTAEQLRLFYERHKSQAVSVDTVKALVEQVRERDAETAQSEQQWATVLSASTQGAVGFRKLVTQAQAKDVNWQDFKRSARAFYDRTLSTVGGLAAGFAAGVGAN